MKYLIFIIFIFQSSITSSFDINTSLEKDIETLNKTIDNISKSKNDFSINQPIILSNEKNNRTINLTYDLLIPLLISIISAILFWLALYNIELKRKNLIRENIYKKIELLSKDLLGLFSTLMIPQKELIVSYQKEIYYGTLKIEELELGMQNKVLNDSYKYYNEISILLSSIGNALYDQLFEINIKVDSCLNFYQELNNDEINTLEELKSLLPLKYYKNYNKNAFDKLNNHIVYPVNPSLATQHIIFYNIYEKFHILRTIPFKSKNKTKETKLHEIIYHCTNENYKKCLEKIDNYKDIPSNNYQFICFDKLRKDKKARETLIEILINQKELTMVPELFRYVFKSSKYLELIGTHCGKEKLEKAIKHFEKINKMKENFLNNNKKLESFYREKIRISNEEHIKNPTYIFPELFK